MGRELSQPCACQSNRHGTKGGWLMKRIGLLVPLVLALALAACNSGGGDSRASGGTPGGGGSAARAEPGKIADGAAEPRDRTGSLATALPVIGPKIVKNASLSLSIPRGKFEDDIDEAGRIANVFGGFVVSSNVDAGSEERLVEGSLVLRIPAEHYADAPQPPSTQAARRGSSKRRSSCASRPSTTATLSSGCGAWGRRSPSRRAART